MTLKKYSENALIIYKNLYFNPNEHNYQKTHDRIAKATSDNTTQYQKFKHMLNNQIFRPNTPCMINASEVKNTENHDNNLIACFVTDLDDNMQSIMEMWADASKIYAGAGGLGLPITNLREKGATISNGGFASGPLIYLNVIQTISETVRSGGKSRRAANLASFWYKHPDIIELVNSKIKKDKLSAINISVLVDDKFMQAVADKQFDNNIDLISPNKDRIIGQITVGELWNNIVNAAWECGDPGLLFFDICNNKNPIPSRGKVVCANPCLPSWAPVLTPEGYKHFKNIKNQIIIHEKIHACSDVIKTRENAYIYELELQSGLSIYTTGDHKITTDRGDIELKNLHVFDTVQVDYTPIKYVLNPIDFNNGIDFCKNTIHDKTISILSLRISQQLGFINYLLKNKINKTSNKLIIEDVTLTVLKEVQLVLASIGVFAVLKMNHLFIKDIDTLKKHFPINKQYKSYNCLDNKKFQVIQSIKKRQDTEDVYDIQVPGVSHFVTNTVVVHNCGEITLPPYHCCILGSINLNKILNKNNQINWNLFKQYIQDSSVFLDNMIDKTSYPNDHFKNSMIKNRPIGLGIMGLADLFCRMNITYGSDESIKLFKKICKFLTVTAFEYSIQRCVTKQVNPISIPEQDKDYFIKLLHYYGVSHDFIEQFKNTGIRNSHVTCVAPTGSISISAECSYAFEPIFGMIWKKKLVDNKGTMNMVNEIFMDAIKDLDIKQETLIDDIIKNNGSIQNLDYIPDNIKNIFVTAHDVGWEKKIKMQEAGQRYITLAISSTCNLPNTATKEDVSHALSLAWKSKLKGISIYRDGCLSGQPVNLGTKKQKETQLVPISRPIQRSGQTVEINTPFGRLYITGNVDKDGRLIEIFLNLGHIGHLDNLLLNTLARVISKSLQNHLPPDVLVDTMIGMAGNNFWFKISDTQEKPFQAQSIVDAIAIIIDIYFNDSKITRFNQESSKYNIFEICPVCGKHTLNKNTGCKSGLCESCGYTACS